MYLFFYLVQISNKQSSYRKTNITNERENVDPATNYKRIYWSIGESAINLHLIVLKIQIVQWWSYRH